MQIEIRFVSPDPNCNKAKILDQDSLNQDPKHSHRYVPVCGSIQTDELSRYRYLYGFSGSETLIKGHEEFTKLLKSRFFLPFYLMIYTSDQQIRTREAQKLMYPDLEHCPLVLPVLDILFL